MWLSTPEKVKKTLGAGVASQQGVGLAVLFDAASRVQPKNPPVEGIFLLELI